MEVILDSFPAVVLEICAYLVMRDLKAFLGTSSCARRKYKRLALARFWRAHTTVKTEVLLVDVRYGLMERCKVTIAEPGKYHIDVTPSVWGTIANSMEFPECDTSRLLLPCTDNVTYFVFVPAVGSMPSNNGVFQLERFKNTTYTIRFNGCLYTLKPAPIWKDVIGTCVKQEKQAEAAKLLRNDSPFISIEKQACRRMLQLVLVPHVYRRLGVQLPYETDEEFPDEKQSTWFN